MIKITVLNIEDNNINEYLKTRSGIYGGICYEDDNCEDILRDKDKGLKRYNNITKLGHHSISDHTYITLLIENIPKFGAIMINSVGMYNTSEKSGRYTKFNNNTPIEDEMYNKWIDRFKEILTNIGVDKNIDKLAYENARYMLDSFNPSTKMVYSISFRNLSYLYARFNYLIKKINNSDDNLFMHKLYNFILEFNSEIKRLNLYDDKLVPGDNEWDMSLSMFNVYNTNIGIYKDEIKPSVGKKLHVSRIGYEYKYDTSIAALGQHIRHRTIDYICNFHNMYNVLFLTDFQMYRPYLLKDEYKEEWYKDIKILISNNIIPMAVKVDVLESGKFKDLKNKLDLRLTPFAQYEIYNDCLHLVNVLRTIENNYSEETTKMLDSYCDLDFRYY